MFANYSCTIRLPVHVGEQCNRLLRAAQRLETELGRQPTTEELSAETGIAPDQVEQTLRAAQVTVSLEQPVGLAEGKDSNELGDLLEDEHSLDPVDQAVADLTALELHHALNALPGRERHVLQRRYGLTGSPATLQEIAHELGLSRALVWQLEQHGLAELAHTLQ